MSSGLQAICAPQTPCKCCGALAVPYGVVDFHKNCELYRKNALDISGVPIYYHRCPDCKFIFTTALDHFTTEDFLRYVYNDEYLLIDPDFKATRPRANAEILGRLFREARRGEFSITAAVMAFWPSRCATPVFLVWRPTTRLFETTPRDHPACLIAL